MPSFTKLFSSLSSKKTNSNSPLQPAATNTASSLSYDEYHTPQCNKPDPNRPILITVAVESPPLMLFGPPSTSSGAFFSGTFILDIFLNKQHNAGAKNEPSLEPMMSVSQLSVDQIKDNYIIMKNVTLYFIQTVRYGKPFVPNSATLNGCGDCNKKITELARWEILGKKTAFAKGSSHSCPFSYILPGSLPPSTSLSNTNTTINYELICKATYIDPVSKKEKLVNLSQPLKIYRSILREQDRNSTRVFPPTDVTATAVIPNVIYPRSTFPVEIRMDHVATPRRRWRMRKLNWRLEECVCVKTNHCSNHNEKFKEVYNLTKKQKKSARISKNSGGAGHANLNYYFETPKNQLNNNNNSIPNPDILDVHPDDDRAINPSNASANNNGSTSGSGVGTVNNTLAPAASNWSVSTTSPVVSRNNNNTNPNSLDQVLSDANVVPTLSSSDQHIAPLSSQNGSVLSPVSSSTSKENEMFIEEIRTISSGELKSGWKSDFSGHGRIELVVEVSLMNLISMGLSNTIAYKSSINSQTCNKEFNTYDNGDSGCNCSIDVDDPELGIYVSHNLIIELVVAEELMQSTLAGSNQAILSARSNTTHVSANSTAAIATGNISQSRMRPSHSGANTGTRSSSNQQRQERQERRTTLSESDFPDDKVGPDSLGGNKSDANNHLQGLPTGVARVLRMQFKVILCERSGMGVAWSDEVPPTYHSVGALSPPTYAQAEHDSGPAIQDLVVPLEGNNTPNLNVSDLGLEDLRI